MIGCFEGASGSLITTIHLAAVYTGQVLDSTEMPMAMAGWVQWQTGLTYVLACCGASVRRPPDGYRLLQLPVRGQDSLPIPSSQGLLIRPPRLLQCLLRLMVLHRLLC